MKKFLSVLLLQAFLIQGWSQEEPPTQSPGPMLKIYLECSSCDLSYLSENLELAELVTDPAVSDVRIRVSEMNTAGGDIAFSVLMTGNGRFQTFIDTVMFSVPPGSTPDEIRNIRLEKLKLGLVPVLLKTPASDKLLLFIDDVNLPVQTTRDPWKSWSFDLGASGSLNKMKSYSNYNLDLSFSASRVTDKFKLESYNRINYDQSEISYPDPLLSAFNITTYQRGFKSSNLAVGSLGDHFGIGGLAVVKNDLPGNMKLRWHAGPAIEYNVYSYEKAFHKQFRFLYSAVFESSQYVEPTIYDKLSDQGWRQNLSIMTRFNEDWGSFDASVYASSYMQNSSRYSLGANMMAYIRIFRNLSANVNCGVSMYRDRIHQPKGFATIEEVLTSQREMETDYQYNFSFGLTFRFGSKKYPAANPRFSY